MVWSDKNNIKKFIKYSLIYLIALITLKVVLMLTKGSGIGLYNFNSILTGVNLVPFKTISVYLKDFNRYNSSILLNLFASLFIFVPLNFLLLRFKLHNIISSFTIIIYFLLFSLLYSLLNRVLGIGVFDIDFVFLRVLFPIIFYFLLNNIIRREINNYS